ncbi:MAG TPA: hypothetical protein VIY08_03875 [Candidatus Nitrosocosmicus sp.]
MNSKQDTRYIRKRMNNKLKNKILEYNGISVESLKKQNPSVSNCPRCALVNQIENKYCSPCSYPLSPQAYEEIKQNEEKRFIELEEKYMNKITNLENKFNRIILSVFEELDVVSN